MKALCFPHYHHILFVSTYLHMLKVNGKDQRSTMVWAFVVRLIFSITVSIICGLISEGLVEKLKAGGADPVVLGY